MQRDLAVGVARLGAQLQAMQSLEPLHGQEPEPDEGRNRRVGRLFGEPARGVDERLLNDIRGIDATLQSSVEPELDHPAEPLAVLAEDLSQSVLSACAHALRQEIITVGFTRHTSAL
jgi:hypothetical protein